MKKFLAILGLLVVCSQPVFAQGYYGACPTCVPRVQVMQAPIVQSCAPACPVNIYNPCMTGAAAPVIVSTPYNACNQCCPAESKGFWARFFGF